MSVKLPSVLEQRRAELNAALLILRGLLSDPSNFAGLEDEGQARQLLVGRLEALEQALQNLSGDVNTHYHSTDRDLQWSTGKLPYANNSDIVLDHINNVHVNPHNITYAILGADLSGLTLTNGGQAINDSDIPNLAQIQALVSNAVANIDLSGIDLSAYEPAFVKNTAFNKDFGGVAGSVAEGNHNHDGVYEPANASILAHLTATENPHGVTAEQIGAAPGIHDHDGIYEPANDNIQLHIISTANPHNVTAGQIGAALVGHDHAGLYEPADANLQQHLVATDNPHGVSPGQIGAADLVHDHAGLYEPADANLQQHLVATDNPHGVTPGQIGAADLVHDHNGLYEPLISPKGTAFNRDFGTVAGTVAEGNHDHECLLTPSTVIYVDGNATDEYLEYFEYFDDCIEAGTEAYPFKTLAAAVAVAPFNSIIKIKPGVQYTDSVILPSGVSLEGYGASQVIISGDVITGEGSSSLRYIQFVGMLTLKGVCSLAECICGNVVISGTTVAIFNSQILQNNAGVALDLTVTNATHQIPNVLSGVIVNGDIACGDQNTIIEGVHHITGETTGTALILRRASMLQNDSDVLGATVKDALNTLASISGGGTLYTDTDARAACVAQTITDGVTESAPSQDAVFDALAQKADLSAIPAAYTDADARAACVAQTITNGVTTSSPSENTVHDALALKVDGNVPIVGGTATKITYDSKGLVTGSGILSASDIPNLDADKITSGVLNIARIPAAAIERLVPVVDEVARFALTTNTVQLGDTVKQIDTGIMYVVIDEANLSNAAGYVEYTAATAAAVPWAGVTGTPTTLSGYGVTDIPMSMVSNTSSVSGATLEDALDVIQATISQASSVELVPEFGNCVFSALSFAPNTLGTMTTEHDLAANLNYYKWVSAQAIAQSYALVVFIQTPDQFDEWTSCVFNLKTEGASAINIRLFDSQGLELLAVPVSSLTAWSQVSLDVSQLATLNGGDWSSRTFKIICEMSTLNNEACYLGNMSLSYARQS